MPLLPHLLSTATAMIRSNPTAIPLRASDIKLLHAEIERRRGTGEHPAQGQAQQSAQSVSGPTPAQKEKQNADREGYNALEDNRRRREGMTAAERIGLQ